MGRMKGSDGERQERVMRAIGLSIEAGAIEECPVHEGTYIDTMEYSDPEELTNVILDEEPDALEHFEDREEMVERVQDALHSSGEECPSCERNRDS